MLKLLLLLGLVLTVFCYEQLSLILARNRILLGDAPDHIGDGVLGGENTAHLNWYFVHNTQFMTMYSLEVLLKGFAEHISIMLIPFRCAHGPGLHIIEPNLHIIAIANYHFLMGLDISELLLLLSVLHVFAQGLFCVVREYHYHVLVQFGIWMFGEQFALHAGVQHFPIVVE